MNEATLTAPVAPTGHLRIWLSRAPAPVFALYAGMMAFGAYFAMYAFRKPFTVANYGDVAGFLVDYKIALVIAQVVGYALSKLIGVKVISELPANRRVIGILAQIALAETALVLFALIPPPWNIACLLVDGLALGMIWGMVFAFIEGRRQTEIICAMLCASFILSSGVVKAAGEAIMLQGWADRFWMPAMTGLAFTPMLLLCLMGLAVMPPPTPEDIAARVRRAPMDGAARAALLRRYAPGLVALMLLYIMLTTLRDFRDNFAAEIWAEAGLGGRADLFAWTEVPVSMAVLGALAALTLFRDNRSALAANFALMGLGLALAGLSSAGFAAHAIGPITWMIMLGGGLYLAYTPFNGILFDRLVAASARVGNAGFLIYVADTGGYAGSVALLLLRNFGGLDLPWTHFLVTISLITALGGMVLLGFAALYFYRRMEGGNPA